MRSEDWNPYFVTQRINSRRTSLEDPIPRLESATALALPQLAVEDVRDELSYINSLSPGRILDLRCGTGALLSRVDNAWEKHGVEPNDAAASDASAIAAVFVGDLCGAAYPSSYFDVVLCYDALERMQNPVAELREVFRVLRPGGHLIVATPDHASPNLVSSDQASSDQVSSDQVSSDQVSSDQADLREDGVPASGRYPEARLFSAESLNRLLWDLGFFVDRTELPRLSSGGGDHPADYGVTRVSSHGRGIATAYCKKPVRSEATEVFAIASRIAHRVAVEQSDEIDAAKEMLEQFVRFGGQICLVGDGAFEHAARLEVAGFKTRSWADPDRLPPGMSDDDLLFVVATAEVPDVLIRAAKARGIRCVVLVSELCEEPDSDVVIDIPSVDPRVIEFVQFAVTSTLCLATDNVVSDLPAGLDLREHAAE